MKSFLSRLFLVAVLVVFALLCLVECGRALVEVVWMP